MMDRMQKKLKEEAELYFNGLPEYDRDHIEAMYQAFKKRLISELAITGGSNMGVVYGKLEDKWSDY